MTEKILYICDEKPGACNGWKSGWKKCENQFCYHTSNVNHGVNCKEGHLTPGQHFAVIRTDDICFKWEVTAVCNESLRCDAKLECAGVQYCIDGKCPIGTPTEIKTLDIDNIHFQ